jgi:hypothetical protein
MKGMPMASAPAVPLSETNVRLLRLMFSSPDRIAASRPFSFDHAHYFMFGPGQGARNGTIMQLGVPLREILQAGRHEPPPGAFRGRRPAGVRPRERQRNLAERGSFVALKPQAALQPE